MSDEESGEEKIVVCSGYFDPLHVGHLENFELAKKLGGKLIVIVNNDEQAILKKGFVFMPEAERMKIVEAIGHVDEVFLSVDKDRSICESLRVIKPHVFAKGGDRSAGEIPEGSVCEELGIEIIDGLGEKIQSSSELVARAEREAREKLENGE